MPTRQNTRLYAMYVIGEVESRWDWTAVNTYGDAITIGMLQWYGQRAEGILERTKAADPQGWAAFEQAAPALASQVGAGYGWSWWASRYLTSSEIAAWQQLAASDQAHDAQQLQWYDDYDSYVPTLTEWGLSEDRPQTLVYAMSMYHQSPQSAGNVIGTCGGSASLELMHTTCLNDGVLGAYRTRYETIYGRLSAWDGESAPPDFGQNGELAGTGNNPGVTQGQSAISRIEFRNGRLVAFGPQFAEGLSLILAGGSATWVPSRNSTGTSIGGGSTGGGSVPPGSTAGATAVQWGLSHLNEWSYGNGGGRLSPMTSGYTDCSGFVWCAYWFGAGVELTTTGGAPAQWTGTQSGVGAELWRGTSLSDAPWSQVSAGDILLMTATPGYLWAFDGYSCHAELLTGNGQEALSVHGTPCPVVLTGGSLDVYASGSVGFMIRRPTV